MFDTTNSLIGATVGVEKSDSLNTDLKTLRCSFPKNVIFSYININTIRNKLDNLQSIINNTVDVLAIAETKIDDSFPSSQFNLQGYKKPYRLDIYSKSGGLLIYVNNDITSRKPKNLTTALDIQAIPVELNLKKQKWLIISIYRPPKQCLSYFLEEISNLLDMSIKTYENIVLMGDFNVEPSNIKLKYFMEDHNLYNTIKHKTCFKDIDRSFLYIFLIKKFHGNIVFFAYESIYHWKGNYIVLIFVKILLKKISYFGCY